MTRAGAIPSRMPLSPRLTGRVESGSRTARSGESPAGDRIVRRMTRLDDAKGLARGDPGHARKERMMSTEVVRPAGKVRLTVDEFRRIIDTGVFEGRHVQLLDGELFEVTKNPPHDFTVSVLAERFRV